jgi:hypothetical protein
MTHSLAPTRGGSGKIAAGNDRGSLKSPPDRAAHYRDYAAQIRSLAQNEQNAALRERLVKIAHEHKALAKELMPKRG